MEARAGIGLRPVPLRAARWCAPRQEKAKPNGERLPEYTDSRLALLEKARARLRSRSIPSWNRLTLEFWLTKLRENLTADAPGTKTFLGKDSPEALAARLSQSKLGDPAYAQGAVGRRPGGDPGLRRSDDPLRAGHRRRQPRRPQGLREPRHRPHRPRRARRSPRRASPSTAPASIPTRPSRCASPTARSTAGPRMARTVAALHLLSRACGSAPPARIPSSSRRAG